MYLLSKIQFALNSFTEGHVDKLNELYHLPKKEAKFFIMKKMNGVGIIKNGIVVCFILNLGFFRIEGA